MEKKFGEKMFEKKFRKKMFEKKILKKILRKILKKIRYEETGYRKTAYGETGEILSKNSSTRTR